MSPLRVLHEGSIKTPGSPLPGLIEPSCKVHGISVRANQAGVMTTHSVIARSVVLAAVLAGVALTGCASATHRVGSPMMGGAGSSAAPSTGPRRMGGGSGYRYSPLSGSA